MHQKRGERVKHGYTYGDETAKTYKLTILPNNTKTIVFKDGKYQIELMNSTFCNILCVLKGIWI